MDNADKLINKINEYLDFIRIFEENEIDNDDIITKKDEKIIRYMRYMKWFFATFETENELYESDDTEKKKFFQYISRINKIGMAVENESDVMIMLAMKSLVMAALLSDNESKKKSMVSFSMSMRKFLS